MNRVRTTVSVLAVALFAGVACAETQISCITTLTTETFDGGTNDGGWCWNYWSAEDMVVIDDGGNPGAYLATPEDLVAAVPVLRTTSGVSSSFTGDYAAENVQRLGIDLIVNRVIPQTVPRSIKLQLWNDDGWGYVLSLGTPEGDMPSEGDGWKSFDFAVPSTGAVPINAVPIGEAPPSPWATLMQDVDRVSFYFGPGTPLGTNWELGIDNVRIEKDGEITCPADITFDGEVGFVDLTTLLAAWGPCP